MVSPSLVRPTSSVCVVANARDIEVEHVVTQHSVRHAMSRAHRRNMFHGSTDARRSAVRARVSLGRGVAWRWAHGVPGTYIHTTARAHPTATARAHTMANDDGGKLREHEVALGELKSLKPTRAVRDDEGGDQWAGVTTDTRTRATKARRRDSLFAIRSPNEQVYERKGEVFFLSDQKTAIQHTREAIEKLKKK